MTKVTRNLSVAAKDVLTVIANIAIKQLQQGKRKAKRPLSKTQIQQM